MSPLAGGGGAADEFCSSDSESSDGGLASQSPCLRGLSPSSSLSQSNLCDVGEEACDCGVRVDRERKRATAAAGDVAVAMLNAGVAWKKREAGQAGRGLAQSSEESLDCDCLRVTWGWEEEDVQ